jgi:hypothetical protein
MTIYWAEPGLLSGQRHQDPLITACRPSQCMVTVVEKINLRAARERPF